MKRVVTVVVLGVCSWMCAGLPATAQIRSVNGSLRYQHRYQDVLSGGILSTSQARSPLLSLGLSGDIITPRLVSFSLLTTLAGSFSSASAAGSAFSGRQFAWDYYDLSVGILQYSTVRFDIGARDGVLETGNALDEGPVFVARSRRQEQRFSVATHKVRFLPSTNLTYARTRSWSLNQEPFDQRSDQYTLALSAFNGSSSLSLSSSITHVRELYGGWSERMASVELDARKEFNEFHRIDLTSAYSSFGGSDAMTGSLGYSGALSRRVFLRTGLAGSHYTSFAGSTRMFGVTQGFQFVQDDYLRYDLDVSARSRRYDRPPVLGQDRTRDYDWGTNASIQHARPLGFGNLSNSLSASFGRQYYVDVRTLYGGRFGTSFQTQLGSFQTSLSYALSGDVLTNRIRRTHLFTDASFRMAGDLAPRVTSVSNLDYRDDRYAGDVESFRNWRTLIARQAFTGTFHAVIPFSLGLGGSVTWYYAWVSGRTYGWSATFSSNAFFVRGLSALYTYSRSFDPYYSRERVEQQAELRYQWRMLSFELRVKKYRLFDRRQEAWFSVVRPF